MQDLSTISFQVIPICPDGPYKALYHAFILLFCSRLHKPDGFINVVVNNGKVEEMSVGLLQTVALLGQALQGSIKILQHGPYN
jgi:hypothetical protein